MEENYVDSDYIVSYSRFYYLSHIDIPKYCGRMHFFSSQLKHDDLFKLSSHHKKSYLGFTVLRPTPVNVIGRTVVRPQAQTPAQYITCAETYDVNLAGNSLKATGACFQQQDSQVAVCASSAVFMATRYMAAKFGLPYRTTTEISELACQYDSILGRGIPSRGLSTGQIGRVLNSIGYDVLIYGDQNSSFDLMGAVHRVIESEIPVIITFEIMEGKSKGLSHAVTVVGHQWESNSKDGWKEQEAEVFGRDGRKQIKKYCTTASLIGRFVTLDDARGPYRTLQFDPASDRVLHCEDSDCGGYLECSLQSVIIPLPRGIWLSGEQAERKAFSLLLASAEASNGEIRLPRHTVLRTYLKSSNQMKCDSAEPDMGVPIEIQLRTRGTQMPKYVWITEVTDRRLARKRLKIGEVVIDPSSSPWGHDFLLLHVSGRLASQDFTSAPYVGWQGAYSMLCRPTLEDRHLAQFA
ncbi:MAG: hypothetical protein V1737_00760 [Chloroflexota bacterium]